MTEVENALSALASPVDADGAAGGGGGGPDAEQGAVTVT